MENQFSPLPAHILLAHAQAIRDSGQPVVFRAVGLRYQTGLEITLYHGETYITTFAARPPSTALTGLVNFARLVRLSGIPCRVNLFVHAASLPF